MVPGGRSATAGALTGPAMAAAEASSGDERRWLCRPADLADGRTKGFDPLGEGRDTMFVVRRGAAIYGYRNACPHYDNAPMAWKKNEFLNPDRSFIICGAHGALFRVEDGVCETGPCVGEALTPVELEVTLGDVWLVGNYAPCRRRRVGGAKGSP